MYLFAVLSMTTKFVILYVLGHETRIGARRMRETRGRSLRSLLAEGGPMLARMLRTPRVMWTVALLACYTGAKNLTDTFGPLLAVERLGIPEESLALFSAARWGLMLLCYFLIVPRVSAERFRHPLTLCFLIQIVAKLLLIFLPVGGSIAWLWANIALEAFSLALLNPLTESLQLLSLETDERARMLALFFAIMLLLTSPLGAIGGALSQIDRALPFVLTLALYALGLYTTHRIWALRGRSEGAEA
jgi:fucose permease